MKTARDLLSTRVAVVKPTQRLKDVAEDIAAREAIYCAVMEESGKFAGLVRLTEIVRRSADRIFADLVADAYPLDISESLEAGLVIKLLQAQGCNELVVLGAHQRYVGLVTRDSVFAWWSSQQKLDQPGR
jgi:predicted transcriptional regulator